MAAIVCGRGVRNDIHKCTRFKILKNPLGFSPDSAGFLDYSWISWITGFSRISYGFSLGLLDFHWIFVG